MIQRFDPLKINERLPKEITDFVIQTNSQDKISLLDCDYQYLFNDFRKGIASYSKLTESINVPLNIRGERLLVYSRDRKKILEGIDTNKLKKGDKIDLEKYGTKLEIMAKPYTVGGYIYYDSYNYDEVNSVYDRFPYSRPNKVTLIPIKVTSGEDIDIEREKSNIDGRAE